MTVEVKTFATLSSLVPSVPSLDISPGDTVLSVMEKLGIPREKVTIIFINNIHGDFDSALNDGDSIGLFPPIGGG